MSFDEGNGTVEVCAMLSIGPDDAITASPVEIMLATGDTMSSGEGMVALITISHVTSSL